MAQFDMYQQLEGQSCLSFQSTLKMATAYSFEK
jgi:hypothetical protein